MPSLAGAAPALRGHAKVHSGDTLLHHRIQRIDAALDCSDSGELYLLQEKSPYLSAIRGRSVDLLFNVVDRLFRFYDPHALGGRRRSNRLTAHSLMPLDVLLFQEPHSCAVELILGLGISEVLVVRGIKKVANADT